MLLTERRRQFLKKLVDLHRKTRLPIHYGTLANALGVSKWTAYDMLKAIEKMGLLTRSYAANGGESGRSQVMFVPTERARLLVDGESGQPETAASAEAVGPPEEWQATKAAVLALLQGCRSCGLEALGRMARELYARKRETEFCAYSVGLLLALIRRAGGTAEEFVRGLAGKAPTGEMGLASLAGAALGTAAQTMSEAGAEFAELAGRFLKAIAALPERERKMVSDFLMEALA